MADQASRKKGIAQIFEQRGYTRTQGVVVNSTRKPTISAPVFTSSSGKQVNPSAPKQDPSARAGGNTPEKK